MEKTAEKPNERRNGLTKLILQENTLVTVLDLSNNNLTNADNIDFPLNLTELNLSNNQLEYIPITALTLKNIKILNLSSNRIKFFDDTPAFCHTIEKLNLSNNDLCRPPYWVWCKYPRNLKELNVSCNRNITKSLTSDCFNDLVQCKTLLNDIKMYSCSLTSHYELLGTFTNAKVLDLSSKAVLAANFFSDIPCKGLDNCYNIERLSLAHTYLSIINSNIDIYQNLIEIDLSDNRIYSLPNEFCNLKNLEVCILSFNSIMCLPDNIVRLKKLNTLCIHSNKLCMLPENMCELEDLIKLDLYNNYLYDPPECWERIQELDLAQNYLDEPDDEEYVMKKQLLRAALEERIDGRKFESERPETPLSSRSIEIELANIDYTESIKEASDVNSRPTSSPEDWDSDDYWIPHFTRTACTPQSPWLFFVKRKMAEGNFCPMDAHTVSVEETVRYENLCNPQILHESDGQFDDYSSDDS